MVSKHKNNIMPYITIKIDYSENEIIVQETDIV